MTRFYAGTVYKQRGHAEWRFQLSAPFLPYDPWTVSPRPDDWAARQWVAREAEELPRNATRRAEFNAKARLWEM